MNGKCGMDADYLAFDTAPSKPEFVPPPGAVDAHCHVFGPAAVFPFAPGRKYTPCDAPKEKLFELRDFLGFERNVIVQASCHGSENAALIDALDSAGVRARGVAVVPAGISDEALEEMDRAGVRAVRFNFVRRLVDPEPLDVYARIAERVARLGWHVVVYFEPRDLDAIAGFLASLEVTVVVDHMGRPDVTKGLEHEDFQRFVRLMDDNGHIWSKVSCPERLSRTGPPGYGDVIPFSRFLVDRFPERVLWGTDWPHPNMKSHMPDDGRLVDIIPEIATSEQARKALLVDNPHKLYWRD